MLTKTQMCEGLCWNYNNNYYKQNNITTIDTLKVIPTVPYMKRQ